MVASNTKSMKANLGNIFLILRVIRENNQAHYGKVMLMTKSISESSLNVGPGVLVLAVNSCYIYFACTIHNYI